MNQKNNYSLDFRTRVNEDGYKVYAINSDDYVQQTYNRQEFYKITLLSGNGAIYYSNRSVEIAGAVLLIGAPNTPFTWKIKPDGFTTYTCIFTAHFIKAGCSECFGESEVFEPGNIKIFELSKSQASFLRLIFERMIQEENTKYCFKEDLIRNNICVLMHEACKLYPAQTFVIGLNNSTAPTSLIIELAERQFPSIAQIIHSN
jgi:AraC family transcriptional activator of pobA